MAGRRWHCRPKSYKVHNFLDGEWLNWDSITLKKLFVIEILQVKKSTES